MMESSLDSKPSVSVVINCLNGEKYVGAAIDSVFAQTYKDWELVFWDNASTDNTANIVKSYQDNRVKYFKSDQTYTLGKARNLAMQKAKGDYIAFLDADDLWLSTKLEKQIPLFEHNPNVALVFSDTIFFNKDGDIGNVYKKNKPPRGKAFKQLFSDYCISMETAVLRKSTLSAMDEWFDDRMTMAYEKDLFLRIAHDFEIDYIDEPLAKWRIHNESWTHKHYDKFAPENILILEKFLNLYPNLKAEYPDEVIGFENKIAWQSSLSCWKNNQGQKCRELLKPFLWKRPKHTLAYWLSYLGPWSFKKSMDLYFRFRQH